MKMKYLRKFNEDYTYGIDKNEIYLDPAIKKFNTLFSKLGACATKQNISQNGRDYLCCRIELIKTSSDNTGKPIKTYFTKFIKILYPNVIGLGMIKLNNKSCLSYHIVYTSDKQFSQNIRDNVDSIDIDNQIDKSKFIFNDMINKLLLYMSKFSDKIDMIDKHENHSIVKLPLFRDIIIQYLTYIKEHKIGNSNLPTEPIKLMNIFYNNICNSAESFKLLNGLKNDPLYKKFKLFADPDKLIMGTEMGGLGF